MPDPLGKVAGCQSRSTSKVSTFDIGDCGPLQASNSPCRQHGPPGMWGRFPGHCRPDSRFGPKPLYLWGSLMGTRGNQDDEGAQITSEFNSPRLQRLVSFT